MVSVRAKKKSTKKKGKTTIDGEEKKKASSEVSQRRKKADASQRRKKEKKTKTTAPAEKSEADATSADRSCRGASSTYGNGLAAMWDAAIDPEKASVDKRSGLAGSNPEEPSVEQCTRMRSFIEKVLPMGISGLMEEFETIKRYNADPFDTTSHQANPTKNRYKDIFCIEPTRVILKDGKPGDYINANYIKGAPFINDFIGTQGPLPDTVNDFWRMICQENVGYIVMLCEYIELGKNKCEKYFVDSVGGVKEIEGVCKITTLRYDAVYDPNFVSSSLGLEVPGKPARIVYHFQWKAWPDHGVPETTMAALRVLRHCRGSSFATVVHCSAGVGRTGTLVGIEWILQTLMQKSDPIDMKEMLKSIRNQRAHAIQTAMQYGYIAYAITRMAAQLEKNKNANAAKAFDGFSAFNANCQFHGEITKLMAIHQPGGVPKAYQPQ